MFRWVAIGCIVLGGAFALGIVGIIVSRSLGYRVPILWVVYYARGNAYAEKGDYDRAIQAYDQAIRLKPDNSHIFDERGLAYFSKEDSDRAIQDFNQAIQLNPDDAIAFNNRCWARAVADKELEAALSDCDESLRIAPNEGHALDSRGFVYFRMGQYDKAIADYDAALKSAPQSAASLYGRGLAKKRRGDTAGGEADIATANAQDPKISDQYTRFGVTP